MSQPLLFQPPPSPPAPFAHLMSLTRQAFKAGREAPAAQRRLLTDHFQESFTWSAIQPLLPLQPTVSPDVPLSPSRRYRSCYRWLPPEELDAAALAGLDDVDLILRLFDFSPWRPILAQRFRSQMGPRPSTRSAWRWASSWRAGAGGGGPRWAANCAPRNGEAVTAAAWALTPRTCPARRRGGQR